ncbi:hypothetical protein BDB01DRAFT_773614, partial [Pilobolus umbonatus]
MFFQLTLVLLLFEVKSDYSNIIPYHVYLIYSVYCSQLLLFTYYSQLRYIPFFDIKTL